MPKILIVDDHSDIRRLLTITLGKEFEILEYLSSRLEETVPRNILFEHIWDSSTNPLSNTVDVHIKYLKDKLDRPFDYPMIITKCGMGIKLSAINVPGNIGR